MAILSNSWAKHLKNLAGSDDTNKNIKAFTDALAPLKSIPSWIDALVEDINAGILLVGPKNSILQTHSWKWFGGTRSWPDYNIFCLIGTGPIGQGVTVDIVGATSANQVSIPPATEISNCRTILDFEGLGINVSNLRPETNTGVTLESMSEEANSQDDTQGIGDASTAPPWRSTRLSMGEETAKADTDQAAAAATARTSNAKRGARRSGQGIRGGREGQGGQGGQGGRGSTRPGRGGASTATEINQPAAPAAPPAEEPNQIIKVTSAFIMAPFLCNALFDKRSTNPLELIILAREAATKFDARHRNVAGFANASATDHVQAFTN
jgi:hypothetical protein